MSRPAKAARLTPILVLAGTVPQPVWMVLLVHAKKAYEAGAQGAAPLVRPMPR